MASRQTKPFCQRNLKPVFAALVVLIVTTVVWASVTHGKAGLRRAANDSVSAAHSSARRAFGVPQPLPAAPLAPQVASAAPAVNAAPLAPQVASAAPAVDAVTLATPGGGIHIIAQADTQSPVVTPAASPRMQTAAVDAQSGHVFRTVSGLILPCVVHIHATRAQRPGIPAATAGGVRFADPFDGVPEKFVRNKAYENVGSGVIVDSRGFALTNEHVVLQAAELLVTVFGQVKRDFPAEVVAVDHRADLALIRIVGAPALPEARLGDSHTAQVGDWVLAFGSPFGLEQTVTQGIISNRRKALEVQHVSYGEMLQTDAPINRGSSGGPLVNLQAEVIGINTAIYGPNRVFSGAGFAVPVDRAKVFLAQCSNVLNR